MTRPTPRKSSLAGSSPLAPAPETTPQAPSVPASTPEPTSNASAQEKPADAPRGPKKPAKGVKPKVAYYTDPDDADRARGAYRATSLQEGHRSWSDFLAAAVLKETERLEEKYNGGQPFPSIGAGGIPTGRPMGE